MDDLNPLFVALAAAAPLALCVGLLFPEWLLIFAFFLTPFQQALLGEDSPVALGIVDLVAVILFLPLWVKLLKTRRFVFGGAGWAVVCFLGMAVISTWADGFTVAAVVSLVRMLMSTAIPLLIYANLPISTSTCHKCYMAFLVSCNVLSLCVIATFATSGIDASMYTLGLHKNYIGPVLGCGVAVAVVSLIYERARGWKAAWLFASLVFASVGLLFSLSRGGWIATAAGLMVAIWMTRNARAILGSIIIGLFVMTVAWQFLPAESADYASNVSVHASTIQSRFDAMQIVMENFNRSPIIGVGVGLRKEVEPHDVLVLTAGEMGILGLIGFATMFAVAFATVIKAWKLPKSDPIATSVMTMAMVVLCISLVDGLLDVYWRRGIGFISWAGVGMAVKCIASQSLFRSSARCSPQSIRLRAWEPQA